MPYTLDLTPAQNSVIAQLTTILGYEPVEGANPDGYPPPNGFYPGGKIKPFVVINFGGLRRKRTGRSLVDYKADAHETGFDVFAISYNAKSARELLNDINDGLVGFKPTGSGGLHMGEALFEGTRDVVDTENRPTRVLATSRIQFTPFAQKVSP